MSQEITSGTLAAFEADLLRFKNRYFRHSAAQEVEQHLEQVLRYAPHPGNPKWPARTYLLTGPSGSGKSSILRRFCTKHAPVAERLRDHSPVVYVEVPARATKKGTMHALLHALRAGIVNHRASEAALTVQLTHHLDGMGVRMLILDEAQHLFDNDSEKFAWDTADWIKSLANAGFAVVVAGLPAAAQAFDLNIQLKRRCLGRTELSRFNLEDETDHAQWGELVEACAEVYPLRNAKLLTNELVVPRLHAQSEGCFGRLMDFLHMVGIESTTDITDDDGEYPELTMMLLARTAERLRERHNRAWVNFFDFDAGAPDFVAPPVAEESLSRTTRLRRRRRAQEVADAA